MNTHITPSESATVLHAFGDEVAILISGRETGGKYTLFSTLTPPGSGPPPHYHKDEDEWFYVLEGQAEFLRDGQWHSAAPGAAVFVPRGVVHAFRNAGQTPLRMIVTTAPSGFETFFARCAEVFKEPGPPDMKRLVAIAGEHGIFFV